MSAAQAGQGRRRVGGRRRHDGLQRCPPIHPGLDIAGDLRRSGRRVEVGREPARALRDLVAEAPHLVERQPARSVSSQSITACRLPSVRVRAPVRNVGAQLALARCGTRDLRIRGFQHQRLGGGILIFRPRARIRGSLRCGAVGRHSHVHRSVAIAVLTASSRPARSPSTPALTRSGSAGTHR
jgi:hypothetical protein